MPGGERVRSNLWRFQFNDNSGRVSDEERLLCGFVARMAWFVMCIAAATTSLVHLVAWLENGEGGERGATSSGASACVVVGSCWRIQQVWIGQISRSEGGCRRWEI